MFETRWIYLILSTFMSSYGDAVGQERFILTEDQKYTNSTPSVFSGNLIPKLLLCQVNKPCRFVLPIDGRQDQMPFVQNGHRDPGLNVEPIQVWHKLPYRCYQNQKTCPYETMVTVIPQEEKPYQYCIQTTQKDIVNVDELCFVVQGIRDNFMNVTQHFNYPPTFPINSTVKCPNNVTCHYTVEFKRHGGYCNRPSEQFLSDVTIYINETEVKQSACKYDVAITPSANARGNKTVCVSINAIASVVEAHCVNIEVTSESRQELAGPCSRRYCQTGSVCDAVDGSSKCLCPIGYTGTACEKPMQCYQSFPNSITCSGTNCHLTGIIIDTEHFVSDGNIVNITPDVLHANVKIVDILARGDASKICYHVNQPNCKKEGCVLAKQNYQNLSPTRIPGGFSTNNLTYACNTDKICYVTVGTHQTNNNTCANVTVHPNTTINHHRIFHPPTLTQTECVTSILVIGTSKAGEKQQLCLKADYDVKCISIEVKDFEICATNPCKNGGVCDATSNGYNCTCLPGWTGTNCTTNIDECSSNPCHYGECHDEVNNYRCSCYPGFTGLNCRTDIDECSSNPCRNGICIDGINSYICTCKAGYTGRHCDTDINECSENPCSNGTCVDEINNYSCLCHAGYTGRHCQTDINECAPNPCMNGTCIDGINGYTCTCNSGYTGINCGTDIDECSSSPCVNGVCVDGINTYTCNCDDGFTGSQCKTNINECSSSPCVHGVCVDGINNFTCNCHDGFTGSQCRTNIDECLSSPCENGVCVDGINNFTCNCHDGFTGSQCRTNINECDPEPCMNGTCTDGINNYTCACNAGYTGINCSIDIDECSSSPCANGVCVDGINNFTCNCDPGYTGSQCRTNINECSSSPCVHGLCEDGVNNYKCLCDAGFTGRDCGTDIDECSSNPCVNGVCVDGIDTYTCNCESGFTGSQCRTNIDECLTTPCVNGRCVDGINGYTCICSAAFTGHDCDKNINECLSSPCVHGLCEDGVNNYTCLCDAGFTGRDCRTDIDECLSNPCQNRAVCFDGINKVFCRCDKGYTGHYCETDIDECLSNPCMNGAICSDLVNDFNCSCKEGYSGRFCETILYHCYHGMRCLNGGTCLQGNCQCLAGFTGELCETYVDPCVPSPCLHGQCYKHITNFFCDCQAGYSGTKCDSAIDKCGTNPCINGGSCVNAINSFTCNCPIGFTGVTCQTDIDNCRSNPCLHGGNCIDGINNFTCQCQYGFGGYLCETITDFCLTNPCIRGTCFSRATDYHCTCPTGYTGKTCNKTVLTINGPDRVSISVSGGSTILLNCSATGSPATYYWTRLGGCGGINVSTGESDLVIHNASRADGGIYNCTASNGIDPNVTKTFQVTVKTSLNEKCTFEGNVKCSWKQLNNDKFDWTLQNGPTQSSQTGPDSDHTLGNEKGAYLYIEASSPRLQGDYASMMSQVLPANRTVCFKFWYYMYGDGIGYLTVNLKDLCTQKETPLFRQLGDQGQKWIQSSITIPGQRVQHDYTLILTGDIGPTYHGDIAIDDLSITDGVCTSDQMAAPGVALVG